MPLYTYTCDLCFTTDEYFCDLDARPICPKCQTNLHQNRKLSIPNTHSSWHSTGKYGANGYWSQALGRFVDSPAQAHKELESKGFVCEADLPKHHVEDKLQQAQDRLQQQTQYENKYKSLVAQGVSKEDAVSQTWTASDALSGKLDTIYK